MAYLEPTKFVGNLSRDSHSVEVGFTVSIDDDGILNVAIDDLPVSKAVLDLFPNRSPAEPAQLNTLSGVSDSAWQFHTDHLIITFTIGEMVSVASICSLAELCKTMDKPADRSRRLWFVRQLRVVRALSWQGSLGEVIAGGPADLSANSQHPAGVIQITHPTGVGDEAWSAAAERFVIHIARILSFGCGTYLFPVIEQQIDKDQLIWRVMRRPAAPPPFFAPFHVVHMEPIFQRACESFASHAEAVVELDPAIRWLTAPVALWEQRLINAMTALECILERTGSDDARLFMTGSAYKKISKDLKKLLSEKNVPDGMKLKLPDLNRRSLKEQILALILERNIETGDFPEEWAAEIIKARNHIVHTGVSPTNLGEDGISIELIAIAREIVIRMILERIGFEGPFQSWLHGSDMLHFPTCEPMDKWAARQGGQAALPADAC